MGQVRALVMVIGLSLVQIQGVIGRVIYTLGRFEIMSPCFVLITKCKNLSLGILSCFCFGIFPLH